MAGRSLSESITRQLEAYILDKASAYQLSVRVAVSLEEGEIMRAAVSAQAMSIPIPDAIKAALRARTLKTMLMTVARRNREQGGAIHG